MGKLRFTTGFTLLLLLLCYSELILAQSRTKWRIKNRLQISYEFDDNIREVPSRSQDRIQDSSLRFLFHSQAVRNSAKTRLSLNYSGGLQPYFQNAFENKLINEFSLSAALKLNDKALGLRGFGKLKNYLNDVLDFATGSTEIFLQVPLSKFGNEIALAATGVNYQNFSTFDYSELQLRWKLWRNLSRGLTWSMEIAGKQVSYMRTVPQGAEGDSLLPFIDLDLDDQNYKLQMHFNYTKSFLLNLSYTFQYNNSRVARYSYRKHQVTLIFGVPITPSLWLRGYGAAQIKRYEDTSPDFFPIDIDTEKDESNFLIVDISKDLHPSLSALVRLALYNNESIERGRFYRKSLVTLGFDYRF